MFNMCMRSADVVARPLASQNSARPQESGPARNDVAPSEASEVPAPRFQRRIGRFPMANVINEARYLGSLQSNLCAYPGVTKNDVRRLKAFLKRGELTSLSPKTRVDDIEVDAKFKINLVARGVTQEDIAGVQKTLGLLQGVVELDLSDNHIEKLPDLRGMTSLLILKLGSNPLTTIDLDRLPPKVTVWLDGKLSRTVATDIMRAMRTLDEYGQ